MDPNGNTSTYQYDNKSRIIEEKIPFQSSHSAVTNYTYDGNDNLLLKTYTANLPGQTMKQNKTQYTYTMRNQLSKILSYDLNQVVNEVSYGYDKAGNMTSMTTEKNQETIYTYDARNRLTDVTDALDQKETYTYDNNSNMVKKVDRNGNSISTTYDEENRVPLFHNINSERAVHDVPVLKVCKHKRGV